MSVPADNQLTSAGPARPDRHPVSVYLARLAPGSRRAMAQALGVVSGIASKGRLAALELPWASLRYQHTQAVRTELAERYSPATANKALSALRGVLRECFRLGLMSAEDYTRASDVEAVKGSTLPKGRELRPGELSALFDACDATTAGGSRDAALLAVLYGAGLRRAEVVGLDLGDYDAETGLLRVRAGKGRKDRTAYATNGAKAALDAWITARGQEPGPLFVPVHKSERIRLQRLTGQSVLDILERVRVRAKVKPFSPHDCRRSFITHLLAGGADISTVQRMAGHASVVTTQRYDRRGEDAKRKAAELLHVPFGG